MKKVSAMTLWRAIADRLRQEIASGQWRPGERLPSEAVLADRFGVNRHTLREATRALADEGLLFARRGSGVFVAAVPLDYPLGERVRFHRNIELAGRVPGRRIDAVITRRAAGSELRALGLAQDALVHVVEGVSSVDHRPVALFRSAFPAALLPQLPAAVRASGSITRALAECGIADYRRASTRITARIADEAQAAQLQMDAGEALLRTETLNLTADDTPVERGLTWWAAERVTLTVGGHS